jgi:hypothetical protein
MDALDLRATGMAYYEIAAIVGYKSPQAVWKACHDLLVRRETDSTDDFRKLQNERLDKALAAVWPKVLEGDSKAIDAFLRIEDRRSRLLGLDVKPEQSGTGGMVMNVLINGVPPSSPLGLPSGEDVVTVIATDVIIEEPEPEAEPDKFDEVIDD